MHVKKLLLLLTIAGTCALSTRARTNDNITNWETFKRIFNKTYPSPVEEAARKKNFYKKLEYVQKNSGKDGVKLAINQMSDWFAEEYLRLSSTKLNVSKNSTRFIRESTLHSRLNSSLPRNYDIRDYYPQTRIQDQKKCGSCYAFATVAMYENLATILVPFTYRFLANMKIRFPGKPLSVQSVVDCSLSYDPNTENRGCDGGTFDGASDFIQYNGIVPSRNYPYVGEKQDCKTYITNDPRLRNYYGRFLTMQKYTVEHEYQIKYLLDAYFMVGASIRTSPKWNDYHSGILRDDEGKSSADNAGHAVVIVGYGTRWWDQRDYWLIRNSWGENWGEDGYIRIERGKNLFNIKDDLHVLEWGRFKRP